ncbi:MAG: AAA family ATPase [Nanoarchaeota archaeon]|nr:AAA family ATPase [Nanoarchaeota archaeon]
MQDNLTKWNWKSNPFVLTIDPKLFTGYEEQVKAMMNHIENKHKVALLTGNTGSGKTSMLKWLEYNIRENVFYVSKPPQNPDMFVDIALDAFPLTFWEKILKKKPNLHNLPKYINNKLKGNHLVFLLDEAHETNKDVLEWLRVTVDQIDNVSLTMAGLPVLEEMLKEKLETLDQRITNRITLTSLTRDDTRDLIRKRIESVGGSGTIPFTEDAIDKIYHRTGGFPREVLKHCDKLISRVDKKVIDASDVDGLREFTPQNVRVDEPVVYFSPKPPSMDQIKSLPYKQRKIVELLSNENWVTPSLIIEKLDFKSYKTKGHAIRSTNNILHRLMLDGFVQRESRGKTFMYSLTPKVKTMFVEA